MGRDIGGKEMSYAYYIDDFSAAREKAYQEGLDGIRDYDDVLHYRGNLIMKRKIKRVVFILSILVVISLIGISYVSVQKPEKMTCITKEIIQQRDNDEEGYWVFDSRYHNFFLENALVYKDYYE